MSDAVKDVRDFARNQLKWYARRGSRQQRIAARMIYDKLPALAARVERKLVSLSQANTLPPAA